MRCLLIFSTLCLASFLFGQDYPPANSHPFARPGVANSSPGKGFYIEYERHPNYEIQTDFNQENGKTSTDVENKEHFEAKLKIPIIPKGKVLMLADIYHSFDRINFTNISPEDNYFFGTIDNEKLKRTRFTLYTIVSLGTKHYLGFRGEASFNGDYSGIVNFDEQYSVYRGAAALGFKTEDGLQEIAPGIFYSRGFTRNVLLPFVLFNKTFNDTWGIESILPLKFAIRHNFSEKSLLMLGAEYWSASYAIDIQAPGATSPSDYYFKNSAALLGLEWNQNFLTNWTWLSLRAGYAYNFDSKFVEFNNLDNEVAAFPSRSVYFSAGFFLSPPDKKE
jgi:hypothetical protein